MCVCVCVCGGGGMRIDISGINMDPKKNLFWGGFFRSPIIFFDAHVRNQGRLLISFMRHFIITVSAIFCLIYGLVSFCHNKLFDLLNSIILCYLEISSLFQGANDDGVSNSFPFASVPLFLFESPEFLPAVDDMVKRINIKYKDILDNTRKTPGETEVSKFFLRFYIVR